MKRLAVFRRLALASALCALSACSTSGTAPEPAATSRYEILSSFRGRAGQDDVGVRVESHLAEGSLSDEQLKKLSAFIANSLRESGHFGVVLDLTSGLHQASGEVLLDVHVTNFQVASEADRKAGRVSHLDGTIQVTGTNGTNLGSAKIWASGYRLELAGKTRPPDTVVQFASTIVELMQ
ncbi:MAG: hypothetical protein ACR2P8_09985 [Myxococcota bacterium]